MRVQRRSGPAQRAPSRIGAERPILLVRLAAGGRNASPRTEPGTTTQAPPAADADQRRRGRGTRHRRVQRLRRVIPARHQPAAAATMPAGPSCIKPAGGSGCLPIAPSSKRIDLVKPSFANPTSVTNPLYPSSRIAQVIYGGQVEGKPFRTEFTLLPAIKTITWQYLAYLDGRVTKVATDWFGQADDGSVWYFGEDVFDYKDGVVSSTEGTWLAGKDGPPAMIMPAD